MYIARKWNVKVEFSEYFYSYMLKVQIPLKNYFI